MSKDEYFVLFNEELLKSGISQETIKEVIEDYEEHFVMGKSKGKTEEEICEELGDVKEIVAEIQAMDAERIKTVDEREAVSISESINCVASYNNVMDNSNSSNIQRNAPFRKLKIDGFAGMICVTRGDTLKVDFKSTKGTEEQSGYEFYHYQDGDTFYVGVKARLNRFFTFMFHHEKVDISVQVPEFVDSIDISNASGYTKVDSIKTGVLEIHTASGDVTIHNSDINDIKAQCASGNIDIVNCNGNKVYQKTSSGTIRCQNCNYKEAFLQSASGSADALDGILDQLEVHTTSGSIRCTAKTAKGLVKGVSGDINYVIQNVSEVRCETISGDIQTMITQPDLGYCINFNTVSGNIGIQANGLDQRRCKSGIYTYGDQACKLFVKTVSGDAFIKQN